MTKNRKIISGELLVLAGGLLWGYSGACGEYLLSSGQINAHTLVPYRLLIAGALCLLLSVCLKKGLGMAMFKQPKDVLRLVLFSAFGISLCQYMYFWGIELSNAAIATVIQYSSPAIIICVACILDKRLPKLFELIALLAISIGIVLLATNGDFSTLSIGGFALFICFLSAVGSATYALLPARINAKYGALAVLGWAMLISGFVLLCFAHWPKISLSLNYAAAFAAVILLGTVAAFSLFMFGLAKIGPSKASLISSVEPIGAASIAWVWLGSSLMSVQLIGFCLICFGVLISFVRS